MNMKNMEALRNYEATKKKNIDNGSVGTYKADVEYKNHKSGNKYSLYDVEVISANDMPYGGYNLSVAALQDKNDAFVQVSTNFGAWKFSNGILTVKGTDNTGKKGDYTLTLK